MSKQWVAVVLAWCALSSVASAQVEQQIATLNAEALEAYQNLDIDTAGAKLEQAIDLAQQAGYTGPEAAQAYVSLGVVYVAGVGDLDQGLASFVAALCMQPNVQLDPLLSTPDVQQVFMQAQSDAAAQGCVGGGAGAAPPGAYGQQPQIAPQYAQPAPAATAPIMDEECPPGIVCGGDGERDSNPKDFARWFVNLEFVAGFAMVQSGMKADSDPPLGAMPIQVTGPNGEALELVSSEVFDVMPIQTGTTNTGDPIIENRYFFDDTSAWVPDADSFDDFENAEVGIPRGITPVSTKCEADGTVTGPPGVPEANFTQLTPSSYCVRVETPGFVTNAALRINPGYFLTDGFALSLPFRLQFDAGEGSFANMLIGLRGELLFSEMKEATGFPVSWFFGFTYGQIQAKPPPKDPSRPAPYVISGPLGAHTGFNVRYRIHRNFGVILAPEFDLMFPDLLFNVDLSLGVEAAF